MNIPNAFEFINKELESRNEGRFAPQVNKEKKYLFEFSFKDKTNEIESPETISLKINDIDVSGTFKYGFGNNVFAYSENIKNALSAYYAIPTSNIDVTPLPEHVLIVNYIAENNIENLFI